MIKKSRDFDDIIKNNRFVKNNNYIIYYRNNNEQTRFGISVGKKIGNAVARNYHKRVIRNICDINKKLYSKNKDYIIDVRHAFDSDCQRIGFLTIKK